MKTFKSFLEESRKSSAEAAFSSSTKSLSALADKMRKGVTSADLEKQAAEHDKQHGEITQQIRDKIDSDPSWRGSCEHKSLLKKANSHLAKHFSVKNSAAIAKQHENK